MLTVKKLNKLYRTEGTPAILKHAKHVSITMCIETNIFVIQDLKLFIFAMETLDAAHYTQRKKNERTD